MPRRLLIAVALLVLAAAAGCGGSSPSSQQRTLEGVVDKGIAPGATAYVVGPRGTWSGVAGEANVATGAKMQPDLRLRIESNSKTWLTAVVLQLAQEGKLDLDDTVDHVLPGLLRQNGKAITLRQLLHDSSGLIDDNDVYRASAAQKQAMLARVGDPKVRAELVAMASSLREDPSAYVPARVFIDLAAWQPLVATPGTAYHHSNIGWNVLGLAAAKAAGKPLPEVYRERLFRPLGLTNTAFSPQGPIPGAHANGYARGADGVLVDTTTSHPGKFSDGAIVTDARDEATFLQALMQGKLFDKSRWNELYGFPAKSTCGTATWNGEGAGNGYRSYALYNETGTRVAVLLINGADGNASAAARSLYCAA